MRRAAGYLSASFDLDDQKYDDFGPQELAAVVVFDAVGFGERRIRFVARSCPLTGKMEKARQDKRHTRK